MRSVRDCPGEMLAHTHTHKYPCGIGLSRGGVAARERITLQLLDGTEETHSHTNFKSFLGRNWSVTDHDEAHSRNRERIAHFLSRLRPVGSSSRVATRRKMMKRCATFGSGSSCGKKASGARHSSSSGAGDAHALLLADVAAAASASSALETPTGSSSNANRRVTRPVRLLQENVMLELFEEQLRSPSPVRQSAQDVRASITRQSDRPTVILYEASTAEVEHEPRSSNGNWLLPLASTAPATAAAGATMGTMTTLASRTELLDAFDTAQQRECQICFDKMDALQAHVCLDCSTSFCSTCMQWYVELKIQDGEVSSRRLVCPAAHCTRALAPELIEAFASPETFAKYQSFLKNQRLGVRFCPRAGCCAALDEPPFSVQRKVKCGECAVESCMRCGGAYHRTRLCRRVDKRYGKWKRHHNVRACPNCKSDIEKQGGCSHMKCFQCDQEFCWSCLRSWDSHDETLCIPLAFYHSKSRKYGCWAPLRFVTKSAVLGVAGVVVVAGAGVAVVVLPPLIGYHLVRDSYHRKKHQRSGGGPYAMPGSEGDVALH